jgi:hypothetical protein
MAKYAFSSKNGARSQGVALKSSRMAPISAWMTAHFLTTARYPRYSGNLKTANHHIWYGLTVHSWKELWKIPHIHYNLQISPINPQKSKAIKACDINIFGIFLQAQSFPTLTLGLPSMPALAADVDHHRNPTRRATHGTPGISQPPSCQHT